MKEGDIMFKPFIIKHREAITVAGALVGLGSIIYGGYTAYVSDNTWEQLTRLESVAIIGGGFFLLVTCAHHLK